MSNNENSVYNLTKKVTYSDNSINKFSYYAYYEDWDMFIMLSGIDNEFNTAQKKATYILFSVGLLILIISSAIVYYMSKKYTKPIVEMAKAMEEVEQGNFALQEIQTKSKDEIGILAKGFNSMLNNLKILTLSIKQSALNLDTALINTTNHVQSTAISSQQVSQAINEIAVASQSLAEEVEKGTSAMHEISSSMKSTNDSAKEMIELSRNTESFIKRGGNITKALTKKSIETKKNFNNVSDKIKSLEQKSSKINEVTVIIRSISEQTNLLSLNAAIESARAGELGRGFSVVAEEIRKLSHQSEEQTNAISKVIDEIQKEIQEISKNVENTNELIDTQTKIVNNTEKTFKDIENVMDKMIDNIAIVTSKVQEIENNTQTTLNTIENISATSQQTSSSSQEVTAVTHQQVCNIETIQSVMSDLQSLSNDLTNSIKNFKTE
ncbi:methyl-accepting chemotaxis protein [Tepidibacter mesophilus]|uniref:methyl-accepting chemotaxis protein n=1 Tax=Tepidibacter mesophilus TaxID=655607 RepID=UPI000C0701C9|nr:methyl-accepting chemotaxis protein [Tepidibacter mesophilus]